MKTDLIDRIKKIRLLLLDVDGVLTDGRLYYAADGTEIKVFNTLDGHGIKMLQNTGVKVGIITGRSSPAIEKRAATLGISILAQGREDKFTAMKEILADYDFTLEQIAFMGDDYPDLLVMCKAGLALSVPNGHPDVKERAHWTSSAKGGEGAVREACDLIMKTQGQHQAQLDFYTA